MFRASPWVSYPGPGNASSSSSAPASMDAPQIDTLQDDDPSSRPGPTTFDPPQNGDPPSPRTGRFRVKLLVSEKPSSKASGQESVRDAKRASADGADMDVDVEADLEKDGDDDEADEEDQLIDDDDDDAPTSSGPASTRPTPVPTKQPVVGHRGRPRGRPRGSGAPAAAGVKRKRAGAPDPAQPLEIRFEPFPGAPQGSAGEEASPAPKKRKTPKAKEKASAPRKSAGSAAKTKTTITIPPLIDVAPADLSEGPTGTMPSSPIENVPPSPTPSSVTALPPSQSIADSSTNGTGEMPPTDGSPPDASAPNGPASLSESLKDTPLPRYPLPTRPFPVQAPPKIVTGYAPIIPLDRTKLAPRHWRPAQREIRGIAGGRWFVRSWVGDKESPLANASQQASPPQEPPLPTSISTLTMPKLSAPPTIKKTKTSAASSRAESVQPPAGPTAAPVKKKSGLSTAAVQAADDEAESVVSVDAVA